MTKGIDKLGPVSRAAPESKTEPNAATPNAKKAAPEAAKLQAKEVVAAPPKDVYRAWLDAVHGKGVRPKEGDSFQLADGLISGTTVKLATDEGAVHQWRSQEHAPSQPDSRLNVGLEKTATGTQLNLGFEDLPAAHAATLMERWREYGFKPLVRVLAQEQARGRVDPLGASEIDGTGGSSSSSGPMLQSLFTAQEVLDVLDAADLAGAFPRFDASSLETVDVRLTAYASERKWGIALEWVSVDPRSPGHAGIANRLYCYGYGLASGRAYDACAALPLTADADGPTFDPLGHVEPRATWVKVRGVDTPLLAALTLRGLGVPLRKPPFIQPEELLRGLALQQRASLLLTPAELRERLPTAGPVLLQLDAWNHPRRADPPSKSETFNLVAQVLATGQRARFRPTLKPNTDWRTWIF